MTECVLLDVTIRDGGYVNEHRWTLPEVARVVHTMSAACVPYSEVGYLREVHDDARPSASCPPDYLAELAQSAGDTGLVVMVRPGDVSPEAISAQRVPGAAMIRVLVPQGDVRTAAPFLDRARAAGMRSVANLTRVSELSTRAVADAVEQCAAAGADIVYLADSNGSLFPDRVRDLISAACAATDVPIGFHAHDHLRLAFINACVARQAGAHAIDATLAGIGKGGGNLPIELMAAYWSTLSDTVVSVEPLMTGAADLRRSMELSTDPPALAVLSGLLDSNLGDVDSLESDLDRLGWDVLLSRKRARQASGPA